MTKEEAAAAMSEDESDEDWGDVDQAPQKSSQIKSKKRKPVPGDESEDCDDTEEEAEETGGSTDEGSDTEVEEPPPKAKPSASKKRKADPPPAKTPKKAPAKATKTAAKPKEGAPGWHPPLATQAPANKAPRKPPAPKGPTVFAETPLTKTDDGKYVREGMSAEQEVATYKEAMQAQADDWMKKSAKATTLATNGRNKNPKSTASHPVPQHSSRAF